jgi:hypothetical protein
MSPRSAASGSTGSSGECPGPAECGVRGSGIRDHGEVSDDELLERIRELRAAADPVAAATSALTHITGQEKDASQSVESITADRKALDERRDAEDEAHRTAIARRDALQQTSAYEDARSATANAEQLAERAEDAEKIAGRSEEGARKATAAAATARQQLGKAQDKLLSAEGDVASASAQVTEHAAEAGLDEVTHSVPAQLRYRAAPSGSHLAEGGGEQGRRAYRRARRGHEKPCHGDRAGRRRPWTLQRSAATGRRAGNRRGERDRLSWSVRILLGR